MERLPDAPKHSEAIQSLSVWVFLWNYKSWKTEAGGCQKSWT